MKVELTEHFPGEFSRLSPEQFMAKAIAGAEEVMEKAGVVRPVSGSMDGRVKAIAEVERQILGVYERITTRALKEMQRRIRDGSGEP